VIFNCPPNKLNPVIFVSIYQIRQNALEFSFRQEEKAIYPAVLKPDLNGSLFPEIKNFDFLIVIYSFTSY